MRIRLLPSNLNNPAGLQSLTAYLINDVVAIDAGSLAFALSPEELRRVRNVILTHVHLDHIASLPIFISDTFHLLDEPICIFATRESIDCLRKHIFNNEIWPDFEQIKLLNGNGTGLRFVEIKPGESFRVMGLNLTPVWTNHTVPTVALAIEEERAAVVLTSDTCETEEVWKLANRLQKLQAVFVDVSYPNELTSLAETSKHLTPEKLNRELQALQHPVPVFAIHMKSYYGEQIGRQLRAMGRRNVYIGQIGCEYSFVSG